MAGSQRVFPSLLTDPGSPVNSILAEAWTLPQHIPGITPTVVNSDSPGSVSQAPNPRPAFLSSLLEVICMSV